MTHDHAVVHVYASTHHYNIMQAVSLAVHNLHNYIYARFRNYEYYENYSETATLAQKSM